MQSCVPLGPGKFHVVFLVVIVKLYIWQLLFWTQIYAHSFSEYLIKAGVVHMNLSEI